MEGFPLDIQRLILDQVCLYKPKKYLVGQLYPLLSVNRMFRRWVMRYLLDTPDKEWVLKRIREVISWNNGHLDEFNSWNVYESLEKEWTSDRMVSFIMYLDFLGHPQPPFKNPRFASQLLFFAKDGVLYDLREKKLYLDRLDFVRTTNIRAQKEIERLKTNVEKNAEYVNNYEKALESLNKKRKK